MNDIVLVGRENLMEIIEHIDDYPIEVKAVALDVLREMSSQIKDKQNYVETKIIIEMQKDNATKEVFKGNDGVNKTLTLKSGFMRPELKPDEVVSMWTKAGFDVNDIGTFEFKPSWSKAKNQRKFGGDKQLVIDEIFKQGPPSLKIE